MHNVRLDTICASVGVINNQRSAFHPVRPIGSRLRNVRFSNRPFGVKCFQLSTHYSVDVAHGLALAPAAISVHRRHARGLGKPELFDFLGFTHFCATRRSGSGFVLGRKPVAKRMRAKL